MDDVLIATESVEENLAVLTDVLITLKSYKFELNYAKCQFLRKEIKFLGYIIAEDGIKMSNKHVQAIKSYKRRMYRKFKDF